MYQKLQTGRAAAVTKSDSANIPSITGGTSNNGCLLYIGGAGDVKVTTVGGDQVTFSAVPAGTFMSTQVVKVWSTGTTATNILALW
jgi:hypothetical protein